MPAAGSFALVFGPADGPSTRAKLVCLAGRRSVNLLVDMQFSGFVDNPSSNVSDSEHRQQYRGLLSK